MAVAQRPPAQPPAKVEDERAVTFLAFASNVQVRLTPRMVLDYLAIPTRSGKRATLQDAVKFMKMCEARGLNPWEGDAFLQGYDQDGKGVFNLITAHQAFLKRAEVNKEYDGKQSGVILRDKEGYETEAEGDSYNDKRYDLVGGWCKVYRKDRKFPEYKRLDLSVFSSGYARWKKDPAGMIVKCAEADALRSAFPTVVGGLYLAEEFGLLEEKNITPPKIDAPPFITEPPPQTTAEPVTQTTAEPPKSETPIDNGTGTAIHTLPEDDPPATTKEPPPAAEPSKTTVTDLTAQLSGNDVFTLIGQLMKKDNVSEDQVMAHLRSKKPAMATPKQTEIAQLSETKWRNIVNTWETELPQIRAITV